MKMKVLLFTAFLTCFSAVFATNNESTVSVDTTANNSVNYSSSMLNARSGSSSDFGNKPSHFRLAICLPLVDKFAGVGGNLELGKQWYMLNSPVQFGPYATWIDLGVCANRHGGGFQSNIGQRIGLAVRFKFGSNMSVDTYIQYHYGIAPRYYTKNGFEQYCLDGLSGRTFGATFRVDKLYIGASVDFVTHHFMTGTYRNASGEGWEDMVGTDYNSSAFDNMFRFHIGFIWD